MCRTFPRPASPIPTELGWHSDRLFGSRQEGDCGDFIEFKANEVRPWLDQTRAFVDYIDALIARASPSS